MVGHSLNKASHRIVQANASAGRLSKVNHVEDYEDKVQPWNRQVVATQEKAQGVLRGLGQAATATATEKTGDSAGK